MPISRKYNAGSVIYFENEISDKVFILKEGKVLLRYTSIEEDYAEKRETIKPGQFFGVKSAVGHFPREETATAIDNSVILILSVGEFEKLASRNIQVLMKMLKVFSNQLRDIHKHVRRHLTDDASERRDVELFKIGDFYMKNKKYNQASYVYSKYLENYPDGEQAALAKERLASAKKGISLGLGDEGVPQVTSKATEEAAANNNGGASSTDNQVTKKYYEAVSLFSQNKLDEAVHILSGIIKENDTPENSEFIEKSHFQLGKCYLKMKDFDNALDKFSSFLKKYGDSNLMKETIFNIGASYEGLGDIDKAKSFYGKVTEMEPEDQLTHKADNKLEELDRMQ